MVEEVQNTQHERKEGIAHFDEEKDENEGPPIRPRNRRKMKIRYAEPVLFLSVFGLSIFEAVMINLVEIHYCRAVLNIHNVDTCLDAKASHFSSLQKYTAIYQMVHTICSSISPTIISMFFGSWSDTFGRRPLMLLNSFGLTVTFSLLVWGSMINIHPNYFILFNLAWSITGGGVVIPLAVYCYICDTTAVDSRAFRMGVLLAASSIGSLIGLISAPYLTEISYSFALAVSGGFGVVVFLYVLFFLEETVVRTETELKLAKKNPFELAHLKNIYEVCYKKQSSQTVQILIYIALLEVFSTVHSTGENSVIYLFLQKVLGWDLAEYTRINAVSLFFSALISFVGTSKILGLAEMQIINMIIVGRLLSALACFFAMHRYTVYVACVLQSVINLHAPIMKSFVSKIFPANDVGKVLSLSGILTLLSSPIGTSLYSMLYRETLDTYPKSIFLLSIFLCFMMVFIRKKIVILDGNVRQLPVPINDG